METITINKIRPIFFNNGLPKKECLKDVIEISKSLGIKINKLNKSERAYQLNIINACLKAIRDVCRDHHINWLDVKVPEQKYVKHGFSNNTDYISNSTERCKIRMIQHKVIYKKVKEIVSKQLLLFNNNELQ
jgi:hypothetical protein